MIIKILIILFSFVMASEGSLLPKAFLKDLDNNKIAIYDYIEQGPMVLSFWFLACEPCKKEMVFLDLYNEKYSKYGFNIVSINTDNSRSFGRVKPFVSSKKYSFTVLSDPKSSFFRKVGGIVCPYTVIVNADGKIINKYMGYNPGDEKKLEKEIEDSIGKERAKKFDLIFIDEVENELTSIIDKAIEDAISDGVSQANAEANAMEILTRMQTKR